MRNPLPLLAQRQRTGWHQQGVGGGRPVSPKLVVAITRFAFSRVRWA